MGAIFTLFLIIIAMRVMNKYLDQDSNRIPIAKIPKEEGNVITNYFPVVFHVTIIMVILVSCLISGIMNHARFQVLISDGIFQFVSTMLILIITLINPFVPISPDKSMRIEEKAREKDFKWLTLLLENKNWQLAKAGLCILIVAIFVYNGFLVLPDLNQGTISGITIILILFFVLSNIVQLIRNPVIFKQKTLFRLSMLYRSIKLSFFISFGLIIAIFIMSAIFKIDLDKFPIVQGIILLVYNVVMAYNEFKVIQA